MKTLRIMFSGICTLAPGIPVNAGDPQPEKVFVIMPTAKMTELSDDGVTVVARHHPFVFVPRHHIVPPPVQQNPKRVRDLSVDDKKPPAGDATLVTCDIFMLDRVHITVDPVSGPPVSYFRSEGEPKGRPGEAGSADEADARWLADMRVIWPGKDELHERADPRKTPLTQLDSSVAAVVEIGRGVIKAKFPCDNVQPQEFNPAQGTLVKRLFASEFFVDMEYEDEVTQITLKISSLDGVPEPDLVLAWNGKTTIEVRIGNDTVDEIVEMRKHSCIPPAVGVSKPRDNDFDLHYKLLSNTAGSVRPLPLHSGHQTRFNGCLGVMVK